MTRQLTVRTAEISTAAVEIKTLTIQGKQVTLAVFRQLRERELVAEDGTLNGVPWGAVNYHPDKCGDAPEHVHIVWQDGSELYRSTIYRRLPFPRKIWTQEGDHFLAAVIAYRLRGGTGWFSGLSPWLGKGTYGEHCYSGVALTGDLLEPWHGEFDLWPVAQTAVTADIEARATGIQYSTERAAEALAELDEALGDHSLDELHDVYVAAVSPERDRRDRHVSVRRSLADLPQLFIAV